MGSDRQHLLVLQDQKQRQIDELAYKHPILLMDASEDDEVEECDGERDPCEQTDGADEEKNAGQESLIVPRPKMHAFQSIKEQGGNPQDDGSGCRLVGKVNPNILKTWEQLFGGTGNACAHQRRTDRTRTNVSGENSITITATTTKTAITATMTAGGSLAFSSSNIASEGGSEADDRQSCLLYCPQQQQYSYTHGDELFEFKVNRLEHPPHQSSFFRHAPSQVSSSTTCTTATARNSSDGVDFYDSIDAASTCLTPAIDATVKEQEEMGAVGSYNDSAGGEALAELTSLDRKRLLWSIAIE